MHGSGRVTRTFPQSVSRSKVTESPPHLAKRFRDWTLHDWFQSVPSIPVRENGSNVRVATGQLRGCVCVCVCVCVRVYTSLCVCMIYVCVYIYIILIYIYIYIAAISSFYLHLPSARYGALNSYRARPNILIKDRGLGFGVFLWQ